jgi:hypothetical protein
MNRAYQYAILISLVIGITLSGCQMEEQATKIGEVNSITQAADQVPQNTPQITYQVGDIIRINSSVLVVLGWDQPPGGDFNPPDEGKKYLVVDLMIANQGDRSFNVSPAFQMSLKAPDGKKYNVNGKANLASGSNPPNGEVNPGEILRGKVGFHVPEDLSNAVFVYEANLIGLGEVSVNLGSTPLAIEPPQDLDLANQQKVFQIGEVVEISGLAITVLGSSYPSGTDVIQPKQGYKFVGVDVQVENLSSDVQEVTSIVQMYLKDEFGQKYTFHLGAQSVLDTGLPDDELQPGERIRGEIGFQVPDDVGPLIFVFDADVFGYGKVFIALD